MGNEKSRYPAAVIYVSAGMQSSDGVLFAYADLDGGTAYPFTAGKKEIFQAWERIYSYFMPGRNNLERFDANDQLFDFFRRPNSHTKGHFYFGVFTGRYQELQFFAVADVKRIKSNTVLPYFPDKCSRVVTIVFHFDAAGGIATPKQYANTQGDQEECF